VARTGDRRGSCRALVGKPEGMRPLGRPRRRLEYSTKWIFRKKDEEACTGLVWFNIGTGGRSLSM